MGDYPISYRGNFTDWSLIIIERYGSTGPGDKPTATATFRIERRPRVGLESASVRMIGI